MRIYEPEKRTFGRDVDVLAGYGGLPDRLAGLLLVFVELGRVDVADAALQRECAGRDGGLPGVSAAVSPGEPGDGGAVEEGERGSGWDGHGRCDWEGSSEKANGPLHL